MSHRSLLVSPGSCPRVFPGRAEVDVVLNVGSDANYNPKLLRIQHSVHQVRPSGAAEEIAGRLRGSQPGYISPSCLYGFCLYRFYHYRFYLYRFYLTNKPPINQPLYLSVISEPRIPLEISHFRLIKPCKNHTP
jgi:hypothetical protein